MSLTLFSEVVSLTNNIESGSGSGETDSGAPAGVWISVLVVGAFVVVGIVLTTGMLLYKNNLLRSSS
jgi:hypothetical protein